MSLTMSNIWFHTKYYQGLQLTKDISVYSSIFSQRIPHSVALTMIPICVMKYLQANNWVQRAPKTLHFNSEPPIFSFIGILSQTLRREKKFKGIYKSLFNFIKAASIDYEIEAYKLKHKITWCQQTYSLNNLEQEFPYVVWYSFPWKCPDKIIILSMN